MQEIEYIRDKTPGLPVLFDLGGPTANMWRLNCKAKRSNKTVVVCLVSTLVFGKSLDTDQMPLVDLYRDARELPGIKNPHRFRLAL